MRIVTIKEAKARLNELVEAATAGEDVVIMRGTKHVAAIVPISADDLEISSRLGDGQAQRIWDLVSSGREEGTSKVFGTADEAADFLEGRSRHARRREGGRGRASPTRQDRRCGSR